MNRRTLLTRTGGALTLAVLTPWQRGVLAQATPAASDPFADYPGLNISVSDDAIPTIADTPAGLIALDVVNAGTKDLHFAVLRLPDDVSNEQAITDLPDPTANPAWFDLNTIPSLGNPDSPAPGVVNATPGRWLAFDPIDGRAPAFWTFTGSTASPATMTEPVADVEVGLPEMDFTGLDHPVPAGGHVWKIANAGTTGHEFVVVHVPADTTKEKLVEMVKVAE